MFGLELGMQDTNNKKFKFSSDEVTDNDLYKKINNNNDHIIFNKTSTMSTTSDNSSSRYSSQKDIYNNKLYNRLTVMPINDEVINKVGSARSLFTRILFLYFIYILSIIAFIFITFNKSGKNLIKLVNEENGKFIHQCELEDFDFVYYSLDLFIYVIILIKGKKILSYNCIFKSIKYITYISFIGIAFGPTTNVILFLNF